MPCSSAESARDTSSRLADAADADGCLPPEVLTAPTGGPAEGRTAAAALGVCLAWAPLPRPLWARLSPGMVMSMNPGRAGDCRARAETHAGLLAALVGLVPQPPAVTTAVLRRFFGVPRGFGGAAAAPAAAPRFSLAFPSTQCLSRAPMALGATSSSSLSLLE